MSPNVPTKKEIEVLSKQINQDQAKVSSAEKRFKINMSFKKAIKKMGHTPSPKKRGG